MAGPTEPTRPNIDVQVGGAFTGQLAAGSDNTQVALNINVGDAAGDTLAFLDRALGIEPIARPIDARPTDFPDLLGRDAAVAAAERKAEPPWMGVVGAAGIGKTVLLRHLAGRWGVKRRPDGSVYLPAAGMVDLDIAYALFDLFYRTRPRGRPSRGELVASLNGIQAVVMLDDVDDAHLADTLALMRGTTFVVASQRPTLTEGTRMPLVGLDASAATRLVEKALGRPLGPGEQADAERLAGSLHGVPADILREVADATIEGRSLADLVSSLAGGGGPAAVQVLTDDERRVAAAAAALGGVPVGREHLAAVTGSPAAVDSLEQRGIVRAASPTLVLDASWLARLSNDTALSQWHSRWLDYFAAWASNTAATPADVSAEAPALAHLLAPTRFGIDPKRSKILVRAVLPALTLTSRWGLRRRLLELVLAAVDTSQEPEGGSWALHQLGTQDAVEGRLVQARDNLTRALEIRRAIGDLRGYSATQQNLRVLDALSTPIPHTERDQPGARAGRAAGLPRGLLLAGAAGLLAVAGVVVWLLLNAGGTAASVSPGNLGFASAEVGQGTEVQTVRISAGSKPARITNVRIDQESGFQLVGEECTGAQLAANTSCNVALMFAPTRAGSAEAALLVSIDGLDAPLRVALSAEAIAASPSAAPTEALISPSLAPPITPSPTPSAGPADLAINVFDVGVPRHEADGWHVPVTVVISNGGDSDAPPFEVAVLRDIVGTDVVPFIVEGQTGQLPATTGPLAPGGRITLTGDAIVVPPTSAGKMGIDVEADSCAVASPAQRLPCRVLETNEDNNSIGGTVTFADGPDLVVLRIERATASAPNSDGFRRGSYVAVVANTGNAESVDTLVVADVQGGDAKFDSAPAAKIRPLRPGEEETIKGGFDFFFGQGAAGTPELSLTVDPCTVRGGCQVTELNEENNTTTRPIDLSDTPGR